MRGLKGFDPVPITAAFFVLISRIPFVNNYPQHVDGTNFIRAFTKYDVTSFAPHLPGYFYFIGLGKSLLPFVHDPYTALILLSILSSVGMVFLTYWLGMSFGGKKTARLAVLITAFSPLFWSYGEQGLSYPAGGFFSLLFLFFLFKTLQTGQRFPLVLSGLLYGLATGVRGTLLYFLFPVYAFVLLRVYVKKRDNRGILLSLAAASVMVLSWVVPVLVNVKNLKNFVELNGQLSPLFDALRSGRGFYFYDIISRWFTAMIFLPGLYLLFIPAAFLRPARPVFSREKNTFLLLLFIPATIFYVLIHFGQYGYVLGTVFLPVILYLSKWITAWLENTRPGPKRKISIVTVYLMIPLLHAVFFLSDTGLSRQPLHAPETFLASVSFRIREFSSKMTYPGMRRHDSTLEKKIRYIREHFKPEETIIITSNFHWNEGEEHVRIYLPEFANRVGTVIYLEKPGVPGKKEILKTIPLSPGTRQMVLFNKNLSRYYPGRVSKIHLGNDTALFVIDISSFRKWVIGAGFFYFTP